MILPTSKGIYVDQNINASPLKNPTDNLHLMSRALHHYSPLYESSRPDYTNDHKMFLQNNNTLEMCLGSGSLPSKPDLCDRAPTGVGSHTMSNGRKGSGKRHLPSRPLCSPLPNPSPCDRILGPLSPNRHLTENTEPLCSAYLSGASNPIRTPHNFPN